MRLTFQYRHQFVDVNQADIPLPSFHRTDVRSVQVAQFGQFFLTEALLYSDSLDLRSKETEQLTVLHDQAFPVNKAQSFCFVDYESTDYKSHRASK